MDDDEGRDPRGEVRWSAAKPAGPGEVDAMVRLSVRFLRRFEQRVELPDGRVLQVEVGWEPGERPKLGPIWPATPMEPGEWSRLPYTEILEQALWQQAMAARRLGDAPADDDSQRALRAAVVSTVRRRHSLTSADLADVAKAYAAGGADAVKEALGVGRRQAERYVARAREKGLI